MSRPRQGFWQTLEDVPSCQAVPAEWRARLGEEHEAASAFLRPTDGRATSHPCISHPDCGCYHDVVVHCPDDIIAVCHCGRGCEPFALQQSDIAILEVDRPKLDRAIARAFGLFEERTGATGLPGTTCIGQYSFSVRSRFPVYLIIRQESDEFESVAYRLVSRAESSIILTAPTRELCSAHTEQHLLARKSAFFALSENLTLGDGGRLIPHRDLDVVLTGFRVANEPTVEPATPGTTAPASAPQSPKQEERRVEWPDPVETCYATHQFRSDGTLVFRVRVEGGVAVEAFFKMNSGQPTKQLQLMRVLCASWPKPTSLKDALEAAYGTELHSPARGGAEMRRICLNRFRPLVSAIRAKLSGRGINPEILPAINPFGPQDTSLCLQLADLNNRAGKDPAGA